MIEDITAMENYSGIDTPPMKQIRDRYTLIHGVIRKIILRRGYLDMELSKKRH